MREAARMTRRLGLAVALLLAVLPQGARAASPDYATIELHGSKSGHVDVRFDERIRIICCSDSASPGEERSATPPLTVRTGGTYAGYAVERLSDGKLVAGGVRVPSMDWDEEQGTYEFRWTVRLDRGGDWLAPGLYRIHLLTDREATVRFRVDGLDEDATYGPKTPTAVTSSLKTPLLGLGQPVSTHRTPVQVDEDTWVVVASLLVAERTQGSYLEHCVVQIAEPCQSRHDYSASIAITPVDNYWSLNAIYSVYRPGHFEPGEWQAQFNAASAGFVLKAQTLALTIDLPREHTAGNATEGGNGKDSGPGSGEGTADSAPPGSETELNNSDAEGADGVSSSNMPPAGGSISSSAIDPAFRSSLAFTGGNAALYVVLALNLLVAGALLMAVDARRRFHVKL